MLNQLFKLGLFVTLGIWLKDRMKGLLLLIFVLAITWVLHNEYLSYSQQSGNTELLEASYAIKWLVFFVSIGIYYFNVERSLGKNPEITRNTISQPADIESREDGFDFLRHKKTLESESDKALKNTKKPGS